jgi:16S rRNA (cytosine1402-N4)-methyltransferase
VNDNTGPEGRHVPVLLGPVLQALNIKEDGCYVDGTFGRGGHSREILRRLGKTGRLLAIDRDPQAIDAADPAMRSDPRFEIVKDEIAHLENIAAERGLLGKVDGLLLDLGVSSPQLDEAGRGFSFRLDGPLDMRMDTESGVSAAEWLASVDEKTLKKVIGEYGEERFAGRIARAIVAARASKAILRTGQLAELIASVAPAKSRRIHPATKTFQAIRIFINRELEQLDAALAASLQLLAPGGRLCVISFHSLEDRRVKRFLRNASRVSEQYRGMPSIPEGYRPRMKLTGKAVTANADEIAANPRARSARLRTAERI